MKFLHPTSLLLALTTLSACDGGASTGPAAAGSPSAETTEAEAEPSPPPSMRADVTREEAIAAAPVSGPPVQREEGPRLTTQVLAHDFGLVPDSKELSFTFAFVNTGDEDLVIDRVKTSCSCTAAELSKEVYAPGEGDEIPVTWKPKGRARQVQTVDIFSNAVGAARTRFMLSAEVDPKLRVDPITLDFKTVGLGETAELGFTVSSGDPSVEVTKVEASSPYYEAFFRPATDRSEGMLGRVDVRLLGTAPAGSVMGAVGLDFRYFDEAEQRPVFSRQSVTLRAKVFGNLKLDPTSFLVGQVDPGGQIESTIRFTHTKGQPFQLTAEFTRMIPDTLEVVTEQVSADTVDVTVRGEAGDYLGRINAILKVRTNVPGEEEYDLAVMGIVRDAD